MRRIATARLGSLSAIGSSVRRAFFQVFQAAIEVVLDPRPTKPDQEDQNGNRDRPDDENRFETNRSPLITVNSTEQFG